MWGVVYVHGGSSSTHIPNLKIDGSWSCIQTKPGWSLNKKKVYCMCRFPWLLMKQLTHCKRGYSPVSKFTVWYVLSIYKMRVKAKSLVKGFRQMNHNEIPDIWQMAVRRFFRVQSMPSCLYKLYWARWIKEVHVSSLMMTWGCIQVHTVGRYSAF